jgi:hypothetical protein
MKAIVLESTVFEYIEAFYNRKPRRSTLDLVYNDNQLTALCDPQPGQHDSRSQTCAIPMPASSSSKRPAKALSPRGAGLGVRVLAELRDAG